MDTLKYVLIKQFKAKTHFTVSIRYYYLDTIVLLADINYLLYSVQGGESETHQGFLMSHPN